MVLLYVEMGKKIKIMYFFAKIKFFLVCSTTPSGYTTTAHPTKPPQIGPQY